MVSFVPMNSNLVEYCGKLLMHTEDQSLVCMLMLTTYSVEEKMGLSEYGPEQPKNYSFNSMVTVISLFINVDQKRDIVSLFPDIQKPFLIHSCSMDRTISTYDLK